MVTMLDERLLRPCHDAGKQASSEPNVLGTKVIVMRDGKDCPLVRNEARSDSTTARLIFNHG